MVSLRAFHSGLPVKIKAEMMVISDDKKCWKSLLVSIYKLHIIPEDEAFYSISTSIYVQINLEITTTSVKCLTSFSLL
jgi:hypothetical protein